MRIGFFTMEFLRALPADPTAALKKLCQEFWRLDEELRRESSRTLAHELYLEAYRICRSVCAARGLEIQGTQEVAARTERTIEAVRRAMVRTGETLARMDAPPTASVASQCDTVDPQCERLQAMLSELKEVMKATTTLADAHKMRLLDRIEDTLQDLAENCCAEKPRFAENGAEHRG